MFFVCTLIVRSLLTLVAMRHVGYAVAEFSTGLQARLIQNLFRARWDYLVQHRSGRASAAPRVVTLDRLDSARTLRL